MSSSAISTHFLSISRDGDFTSPLGKLFQCFKILSIEKFFLLLNLNLPWCTLRTFLLILSLSTWEKRLTPTNSLLSGSNRSDKVSLQPPLFQPKQLQLSIWGSQGLPAPLQQTVTIKQLCFSPYIYLCRLYLVHIYSRRGILMLLV